MPVPDGWDYAVGVDIAEVVRIRNAMRRWGDRFLDKHFTPEEIAYCRAKSRPAESLAARFAAKEAFAKAFPRRGALSWHDVEVVMEDGRPMYRLRGAARHYEAKLSLSHTHAHAVAVAVVRRKPGDQAGKRARPRPVRAGTKPGRAGTKPVRAGTKPGRAARRKPRRR
jgi:holo-[acyl-carrier protein] synthase